MILRADARAIPLKDESVQCVCTSPPFWGLRDYGVKDQLGLEKTPEEYVLNMVAVFREVRRALKKDGILWLNLGDSYAGNRSYQVPDSKHKDVGNARGMTVSRRRDNAPCPHSDMLVPGLKPKDLVGIPWRVAFALQADGWYLRSDIIWSKPNPMPESVTDRPTKAHEYIFLMSKEAKYYYDAEAINEKQGEETRRASSFRDGGVYTGNRSHDNNADKSKETHGDGAPGIGRNRRTVWDIATQPYSAPDSISIDAADYVSADGKPYKASEDCPIHGPMLRSGKFDKASNGGQPIRLPRSNRNSDARPASVPDVLPTTTTSRNLSASGGESEDGHTAGNNPGRKTSTPRREHTSGGKTHPRNNRKEGSDGLLFDSKDFVSRECCASASDHNSGRSRTALAPPTSPHDIASAQMNPRIPNTEPVGGSIDSVAHTGENNNGSDDSDDHPWVEIVPRTSDKPSYNLEYCNCSVVSIAHFATFPEEIPRLCILAGSRPRDIVLDPFGGSGTTAKVALNLGRKPVHIDLTYHELARKRMTTTPAMAGLMG